MRDTASDVLCLYAAPALGTWPSTTTAAMSSLRLLVIALLSILPAPAYAQLSGRVGPTTSRDSKRGTICNVLDYKGVASKTADIGPAIQSAVVACKNGGTGAWQTSRALLTVMTLPDTTCCVRAARRLGHVYLGQPQWRTELGLPVGRNHLPHGVSCRPTEVWGGGGVVLGAGTDFATAGRRTVT